MGMKKVRRKFYYINKQYAKFDNKQDFLNQSMLSNMTIDIKER
jgi:hypothetical protein